MVSFVAFSDSGSWDFAWITWANWPPGRVRIPAILVAGALNTPIIFALNSSIVGRFASFLITSPSINSPSIIPPTIDSFSLSFAKSTIILGDEVNSFENAIAVGPLNKTSKDLADVLSTAIFARLFLATLKDVSASALRVFLKEDISSTVKPLFWVTIRKFDSSKALFNDETIFSLLALSTSFLQNKPTRGLTTKNSTSNYVE